jgi:hypothetical protein
MYMHMHMHTQHTQHCAFISILCFLKKKSKPITKSVYFEKIMFNRPKSLRQNINILKVEQILYFLSLPFKFEIIDLF